MRYRISFEIDGAMLGTVIQVLTDKRVQSITTTPIGELHVPQASKPRFTRTNNTKKRLTEIALLEQMKQDTVYTTADLGQMLEARNLASSSASPTTTKLVRDGKLVRLGSGQFRRNS